MQNPFVYGEVVPAAAFVNRVDELDRLVNDLAASQKIFLRDDVISRDGDRYVVVDSLLREWVARQTF